MANKSLWRALRYNHRHQSTRGLVKQVAIYDEFLHYELGKSLDEGEDVLKKLGYTELVRNRTEDDGDDIWDG